MVTDAPHSTFPALCQDQDPVRRSFSAPRHPLCPDTAPGPWHEDPPGGGLAPGLHLGGGQPRYGGHGVQHTEPRYGGGGINNSRILEFVVVLVCVL